MGQKPGVITKNSAVLVSMIQDKFIVAEDKCSQVDPESNEPRQRRLCEEYFH